MAKNRLGGTTLKVGGFLEEFEKDKIKEQVNIISLFRSYGVDLKKKGSSYIACCPWHDDKSPSLSVDSTKGLYNCFGCGESGDAFSLVMKMENVDFKEAVSILKQGSNKPLNSPKKIDIEIVQDKTEEDFIKPIDSNLVENPNMNIDTRLLMTIRDYYYKDLQNNKKALAYLGKRGLEDIALIKYDNIGYCGGTLLEKLTVDYRQVLVDVGLLNSKGEEFFKGCITFPLTDQYHNVVGFYGRAIDDKNKFKHRYLKGEHKGLFNHGVLKVYDEIILTESIIDGLSLDKLGIKNVLPCYGSNGFSDAHLKSLKDNLVKKIIIGFDSDEAGLTASKKLGEKLKKEGFQVKEIFPPNGNDWNQYLLQGGTKEELKLLLDSVTYESMKTKPFTVETEGNKQTFRFKETTYRVAGVKEVFVSNLRVNIKAEKGSKSYLDNVDLYSARSRNGFTERLAITLDLPSIQIEKEIVQIIEHLESVRDKALEEDDDTKEVVLSKEDKELGLSFLKNPNMFQEIVDDTETLGYVGESLNKQLIYLAASSRLLDDPISVTVISESASGKSYLIDTVKKLIPEEDVLSMTTLSEQALNYLPEDALIHKFMVMGEAVHSDVIDHQIREMLSSKELSRMVTTKDEKTGKMTTKTVRKDVVVSTVMSSTQTDINPENASRVFVINTDESVEQTKRIHSKQREKYSLKRYKSKTKDIPNIIRKHKSAQRMLKNYLIVNEFVEHLTFPDSLMRTRRDHERFIDLISTVCFLRQYQKEVQTEVIDNETVKYIVCDMEDYKIASKIMVSILSATLVNIPKSALVLYDHIRKVIKDLSEEQNIEPEEVVLSQRDIRELTGLSQMIVKRNIKVLVEYEYIKKSGGRSGQKNTYKLYKDESIELIASNIPSPKEMLKLVNKAV